MTDTRHGMLPPGGALPPPSPPPPLPPPSLADAASPVRKDATTIALDAGRQAWTAARQAAAKRAEGRPDRKAAKAERKKAEAADKQAEKAAEIVEQEAKKEAERLAYLAKQSANQGLALGQAMPRLVETVAFSFTSFRLYDDGTIATMRRPRSRLLAFEAQDNSKDKLLWSGKLGEGMMTITVITDDWEWTKAIASPTFLDRKAVAKVKAWKLRLEAGAQR